MTAATIKVRPILFTPAMAGKVHRGEKTQTRRMVKPQPVGHDTAEPGDLVWLGDELNKVSESRGRNKAAMGLLNATTYRSPYGAPGDRLWVKERAWFDREVLGGIGCLRCFFDDGTCRFEDGRPPGISPGLDAEDWTSALRAELFNLSSSLRRRASIHMPRRGCRSVLEISEVRVERVQAITDVDAIAEGIEDTSILGNKSQWGHHEWGPEMQCVSPAAAFLNLFYGINKRAGRNANPWVWVLTFRKVKP